MTFWQYFFRVLGQRPKPALAALYWYLTRRKVRAGNKLRAASAELQFVYDAWMEKNEAGPELTHSYEVAIETWAFQPKFAVVIHSTSKSSEGEIARSANSLGRQIYRNFSITRRPSRSLTPLSLSGTDFLLPVRAGDILSDTALYRFAEAVQTHTAADILYGDEDRIDERGRRSKPWFKPQWNQELFLAQDYLSSAVAIRTSLIPKGSSEGEIELEKFLLSATCAANDVIHVPHVLVHVASPPDDRRSWIDAVAQHLEASGAKCSLGLFGTAKVEWPLPEELPRVTIIVPTRDRLELLRPCVESLLDRTSYQNFELHIIDNESRKSETKQYFDQISKDRRVQIQSYPGPYNFSAMNNSAVEQARGSYVCLLNNDTEVIEPGWLTEMVRYAVRPEVGAVGAKLLYDDDTIQHAGVIIGLGDAAGHAHRFLPSSAPGYFFRPHVAHFVSAVTGACLLISKEKFQLVGGLDESLAVAFNDVDFCLRLQAAGLRNAYVPHSVLIHHESKTRGSDMERAQLARFKRELSVLQERWATKTFEDPLHNPNLYRGTETFVIRV